MAVDRIVNLYNPANQSEEELIDNFVVRTNEFQQIFNDIRYSRITVPDHHIIIQGQRGQGKTSLLLRLYYETKNDPELKWRFIPIIFNEEQYNIRTLFDLWENIAEELEELLDLGGLSDEMGRYADLHKKDPETKAFEMLKMVMETYRRKLILFIDSFGDILNKFSEEDRHRFIEVLMSRPEIRIVGTSCFALELPANLAEGGDSLFKVAQLKGLGKSETVRLFLKLGENYKYDEVKELVEKQTAQLESLRRLTSGVPRTIILLFEIFVTRIHENSFRDLEIILDRVTPLYKHRMDDLPPKQQTIVDVVAMNWEAVKFKDIEEKVRMDTETVAANLETLQKNQIIQRADADYYQLTDRFFNIWYLMRYGKKNGRTRVEWFVQFLEYWNTQNELEEMTRHHIAALKSDKNLYDKHAFFISEALARTSIPMQLQHDLLKNTRKFLSKKNETLLQDLSRSDKELLEAFCQTFEKEDFQEALEHLESIKGKNSLILFNMAFLHLHKFNDLRKAEKYYRLAAEKGHVTAMYNLGLMYENQLLDMVEAEKFYLMAAARGNAKAMNNVALLYLNRMNDLERAERYFFMAARGGDVKAVYNLALFYENHRKDAVRAEKYFLIAVKKGHTRAFYDVINLYFQARKNKTDALRLAKILYTRDKKVYSAHLLAIVLLWNNELEMADKLAVELFKRKEYVELNQELVVEYLLMLLAKKQYTQAELLFTESPLELKERYKPLYYALNILIHQTSPDGHLEQKKIGEEAQETVKEIIAKISRMENEYE